MRLSLFSGLLISILALSAQGKDLVPPPPLGLKGNSNYLIVAHPNDISDLEVEIDFENSLIFEQSSANGVGVSFQINAYSPLGTDTDIVFQQYLIRVDPTVGFAGQICTFANAPVSCIVFCPVTFMRGFGDGNFTIDAGSRLHIKLQTDKNGIVEGSSFQVSLPGQNNSLGDISVNGTNQITGKPLSRHDRAPIVAFQVNIVGNEHNGTFKQGSGTITYSANNALFPLGEGSADAGLVNAAISVQGNSVYGEMETVAAKKMVQKWAAGKNRL
jgi:hypothetical protein